MVHVLQDPQIETLRLCNVPHLGNQPICGENVPREDPETSIVDTHPSPAPFVCLDARLATTDEGVALRLIVRQYPIWPSEYGRKEAWRHPELGRLVVVRNLATDLASKR